jgi:hypothetical protein
MRRQAFFFLELGEEIKAQLRFLNAQGDEFRVGGHLRHPATYLASVEEIHQCADRKKADERRDFHLLFRHINS